MRLSAQRQCKVPIHSSQVPCSSLSCPASHPTTHASCVHAPATHASCPFRLTTAAETLHPSHLRPSVVGGRGQGRAGDNSRLLLAWWGQVPGETAAFNSGLDMSVNLGLFQVCDTA